MNRTRWPSAGLSAFAECIGEAVCTPARCACRGMHVDFCRAGFGYSLIPVYNLITDSFNIALVAQGLEQPIADRQAPRSNRGQSCWGRDPGGFIFCR